MLFAKGCRSTSREKGEVTVLTSEAFVHASLNGRYAEVAFMYSQTFSSFRLAADNFEETNYMQC